LNPYAKVPDLVDGQAIFYESAIINKYLEEKYPDAPLLPADLARKALARIWIDFSNSRVTAAAHEVRRSKDPDSAKQKLKAHFQSLDRRMENRRFIAEEYSLADISFMPFYVRQERYGVTIDGSLPNLKRWMEDLIARPPVQSTL
jgi:glutathione S-transferase